MPAALEILEQISVEKCDRILVVGDGKLGQLIAQTLAVTGCNLLVVGRHPQKLANLESLGIQTGAVDAIEQRTFDIAVDCTGNPEGFETARLALRPRGTLVLKSTYAGSLSVDASSLVVDEITVVGSRCGPFSKALEVLEQGQVNVQPLIHAHYPLAEGVKAFEQAQQRGTLKVLLKM